MTEFPVDPRMLVHYQDDADEERRLKSHAVGRLEWLRTWEVLSRYLPQAPAVIVDVGGGTGAYALPLAREGYQVHLVDVVPRHVDRARAASDAQPSHPLASVTVGDARDLAFADGSADAVLLLGPLYHLTERAWRLRVLTEARRVLRPGGVAVGAGISRYASLCDGLAKGSMTEAAFRAIVEGDLVTGQHRNPSGHPRWFTTAYFHRPQELAAEFADAGLEVATTVGVEGPGWVTTDLRSWLDDPERRAVLLRLLATVETAPELIGASPHLLTVAHRPARS